MNSVPILSAENLRVFPPLTRFTLGTILLSGLGADLGWEIWARVITPVFVGGPLEPAALVHSVFGLQSRLIGEVVHLVVGVIIYPIGYLFIARPVQLIAFPGVPWVMTALTYGASLFIFALYVMAHLIAGFPAFLGWVPLAWCSLFGHLLFGVIVGMVVVFRDNVNG